MTDLHCRATNASFLSLPSSPSPKFARPISANIPHPQLRSAALLIPTFGLLAFAAAFRGAVVASISFALPSTTLTAPPHEQMGQSRRDDHDLVANFDAWSFQRRRTLFVGHDTLFWELSYETHMETFTSFFDAFGSELDCVIRNETYSNAETIWEDQSRDLVHDAFVCRAAKDFKRAGSNKTHILVTGLGKNWGGFSGYVPNRTINWGTMNSTLGIPRFCSYEEMMEYINHPNTLAVVTAQHQMLDHPKVHSIPIGVSSAFVKDGARYIDQHMYRTQLLMVSNSVSPERTPQLEAVIKNFNGTVKNTYEENKKLGLAKRMEVYLRDLQRSKFVLSPSGLGWDCFRIWESLTYGTIPVIERYNRTDGWHRTLEGLPVVWVETFDHLTPDLLESEYARLARRRDYTWEKLTKEFWIKWVHKLRKK